MEKNKSNSDFQPLAARAPRAAGPEDWVCYCFGYTGEDIERDFVRNGRSLILEKIEAEKKAGGCDCVHKNPKGR